jgi:hypothetical protein
MAIIHFGPAVGWCQYSEVPDFVKPVWQYPDA